MTNFYGNESTQEKFLNEKVFGNLCAQFNLPKNFAKTERENALDELVRQAQELGLYEWGDDEDY